VLWQRVGACGHWIFFLWRLTHGLFRCRCHPNADLYPTAHTCFRRIDLPALEDKAEITRRLRFCLDNLELAGFGNQ